jgi:hypothetical protein
LASAAGSSVGLIGGSEAAGVAAAVRVGCREACVCSGLVEDVVAGFEAVIVVELVA